MGGSMKKVWGAWGTLNYWKQRSKTNVWRSLINTWIVPSGMNCILGIEAEKSETLLHCWYLVKQTVRAVSYSWFTTWSKCQEIGSIWGSEVHLWGSILKEQRLGCLRSNRNRRDVLIIGTICQICLYMAWTQQRDQDSNLKQNPIYRYLEGGEERKTEREGETKSEMISHSFPKVCLPHMQENPGDHSGQGRRAHIDPGRVMDESSTHELPPRWSGKMKSPHKDSCANSATE